MPESLLVEVRDSVAQLTLNRPQRRNALDSELFMALTAELERIEADDAVRVTVITGAGSAFCAGMDLHAFTQTGPLPLGDGETFLSMRRTKPLIAAVNGPAVAAGFELVLACELVIAADGARFAMPEVRRGLVAGGGGVWRLVRSAGRAVALAVLLAGDELDATRAQTLGIVNRVVAGADVLAEARALAERVVEGAPLAVGLTMDLAARASSNSEVELWAAGQEASGRAAASEDAAEGARAFLERRPPRWGERS